VSDKCSFFLTTFISGTALEDTIDSIEADMERLVEGMSTEPVWATHYGAFDIDPKHLVYKICLKSDAERIRLANDVDLKQQLRNLLDKHQYPEQARSKVYIGFESEETIDRESCGNPWRHWR
jgi:hypothetical protein